MGHVYADITIRNRLDVVDAARGRIAPDSIRAVQLGRVLVDTGASMLSLPASIIARLGLEFVKELAIATADGPRQSRMFRDATLTVEGREGDFRCIELPDGAQPLLGVLPLEELGIEPDIVNHRLRLLPEEPGNTHILVM